MNGDCDICSNPERSDVFLMHITRTGLRDLVDAINRSGLTMPDHRILSAEIVHLDWYAPRHVDLRMQIASEPQVTETEEPNPK